MPGEGPLWAEAQRQQKEADRLSSIAAANINSLKSQIHEVQNRIDSKSTEFRQANQEFARQSAELDKQKLRDPRYIPVRDDPLMRYVAFEEMKTDPKQGAAVRHLSVMAQVVMLTLELAFLLIKLVFAPASVYTVRLITKTKLEAAQVAGDFTGNRDKMRRQRPPLRVVPRAGEQAEPVVEPAAQ